MPEENDVPLATIATTGTSGTSSEGKVVKEEVDSSFSSSASQRKLKSESAEKTDSDGNKTVVVVLDQKKKKTSKAKHCRKCFWPCVICFVKVILVVLGYLGYTHWFTEKLSNAVESSKFRPGLFLILFFYTYYLIRKRVLIAVKEIPSGELCPTDWLYFNQTNHCYKYFKQSWTWKGGELFCIGKGAHMASILTREENKYIVSISEIEGTNLSRLSIWIGAYAPNKDNVFVWTDNNTWDFTWFYPGEPVGNDSCLEVRDCCWCPFYIHIMFRCTVVEARMTSAGTISIVTGSERVSFAKRKLVEDKELMDLPWKCTFFSQRCTRTFLPDKLDLFPECAQCARVGVVESAIVVNHGMNR
uniref:C-type lectin domain-containing protein n=1 Tax=Steinernema glaseri TaxID=37863 RepID=A0A1I7YDT7_9BILA